MDYFLESKNGLLVEEVPAEEIAKAHGTPLYVYSAATIDRHCKAFREAFQNAFGNDRDFLACFAVKANPRLSFLKRIFSHGLGADVVSGGELLAALKAGCPAEKIVFSGVGKRLEEIEMAVDAGILAIHAESSFEVSMILDVAKRVGKKVSIGLRINPDVIAGTHEKISTGSLDTKFGLDWTTAKDVIKNLILPHPEYLELHTLACHIGSQLLDLKPLHQALDIMLSYAKEVLDLGVKLKAVDMGGGVGIRYNAENPPDLSEYAGALAKAIKGMSEPIKLLLEPGRVIAGNTGILLTRVIGVKKSGTKLFCIVDAAMTELMRPALYGARHDIQPVLPNEGCDERYDVVGAVCETSDILAKDQVLGEVKAGDLLYIRSVGAYGTSMANNYNLRPRPAEVMIEGRGVHLIQRREEVSELFNRDQF